MMMMMGLGVSFVGAERESYLTEWFPRRVRRLSLRSKIVIRRYVPTLFNTLLVFFFWSNVGDCIDWHTSQMDRSNTLWYSQVAFLIQNPNFSMGPAIFQCG